MRTIFDNFLRSSQWTFTAKVGHTLLSYDGIHIMFGGINMATHGHNGAHSATLHRTWHRENAQIAIPFIVTRPANAIH